MALANHTDLLADAVGLHAREAPPGVYFVLGRETGLVKIGRTTNFFQRLASLKCSCGERLMTLGLIPAESPMMAERAVLERFAKLRAHGEWHDYDADMLGYIGDHATPIIDQDWAHHGELEVMYRILWAIYRQPIRPIRDLYETEGGRDDNIGDLMEYIDQAHLIERPLNRTAFAIRPAPVESEAPRDRPAPAPVAKPVKGGPKAVLAAYKAARGIA